MQVEGEMDRTWRISQDEIVKQVGAEAAKGRKEMVLDGGPYRSRYSRNGRCVGPIYLCTSHCVDSFGSYHPRSSYL